MYKNNNNINVRIYNIKDFFKLEAMKVELNIASIYRNMVLYNILYL